MIKKLKTFLLLSFLIGWTLCSCKKELSCEGCASSSNKAPAAIAGNDTILMLPLDSAILDGSNSYDPDGSITGYTWSKISGPSSFNMVNSQSAVTKIKNMRQGIYRFELKVTDNGGLFAKDTVMITVDTAFISNHPPIANAGADKEITLPDNSVILDGSGSVDPDNNIISYQWTKITGPSSFNTSNQNMISTTAASLIEGIYQFELKVTDAGGLFSFDTIKVTVKRAVSNNNIKPVSVPGNDTLINSNQTSCMPVQLTLTLNGKNSYDPDGNIVSYLWTGPGNIANPDSALTTVSGLFSGTIGFSLKVTDNNGATDIKYINFTITTGSRPNMQVTKTAVGTLSAARMGIATASAGNKIFFAGGFSTTGPDAWAGSSRVDIFDITTNSWSIAELSVARHGITAVAAGSKVFFAGGHTSMYGDVDIGEHSTVDIYDLSTNTWSVASLSQPRGYSSSATIGNKVFFAGGYWIESYNTYHYSTTVDIYDLTTNTWSVASLSEPRAGISAVSANNKVYFAGGYSGTSFGDLLPNNKIDIYDMQTNSWSLSTLNQPKMFMGGIAVNNKIYWAGGEVSPNGLTCKVEIRDAITQSTSFDYLSMPRTSEYSLLKDNKILFTNFWQPFDLLNLNTNTWYTGLIPIKRQEAGVISVNNTVYVAGGWAFETQTVTNQVWKLDF